MSSKKTNSELTVKNSSSSSSSSSSYAPPPPTEEEENDFAARLRSTVVNSWITSGHLNPETEENYHRSLRTEGLSPSHSSSSYSSSSPDDNANRTKRPVLNGHYVRVRPTGLQRPVRMVLWSPDVAHDLLGWSERDMHTEVLLDYVSGNYPPPPPPPQNPPPNDDDDEKGQKDGGHRDHGDDDDHGDEDVLRTSWATPYALSIMGQRYTSNCPYGTGNGYGDGRAISIGEFDTGWELQLKGAGTTPFHRGADGRAVFRSSVREFLASEAMHALGVPTTRALSLVVSETETSRRPWYRTGPSSSLYANLPKFDDPRLAHLDEDRRRLLLGQLRNEKADPDTLVMEPCAITCRVSRSFVRIGHLDLFARRATASVAAKGTGKGQTEAGSRYDTTARAWKELEGMVWHACYREYRREAYDPHYRPKDGGVRDDIEHDDDDIDDGDLASAATVLLERAAERLSSMVAHWIRVGFAQGNFNADNCLVGGHTMDYGPFGFMEEYHPLFAKWTGSGQHFGFMNQPSAGYANYQVLVESVVPVIVEHRRRQRLRRRRRHEGGGGGGGEDEEKGGGGGGLASSSSSSSLDTESRLIERFMEPAREMFQSKMDAVFREKMGFPPDMEEADVLWDNSLELLLRKTRVDWTLFWRQLSYVARDFPHHHHHRADPDADADHHHPGEDHDGMLSALIGEGDSSPFYEDLTPEYRSQYLEWIKRWRTLLRGVASTSNSTSATEDGDGHGRGRGTCPIAARMLSKNPKFVLREWMLVDAYTAAQRPRQQRRQRQRHHDDEDDDDDDEAPLRSLYDLIRFPYDEGTPEQTERYYRRAPEEAQLRGGTAFMS